MDFEKFFGLLREKQPKNLQEPTALYSVPYWPNYFSDVKKILMPKKEDHEKGVPSEKTQVMMGLYQYAKKQENKQDENNDEVDVILLDQIKVDYKIDNTTAFAKHCFEMSEQGWSLIDFKKEKLYHIIFLGMELKEDGSASGESWELLLKMARAMGPKCSQVLVITKNNQQDEIFNTIFQSKARIVVGLGSMPCTTILKRPIKLNDSHGKFYDLCFQARNEILKVMFMPLFCHQAHLVCFFYA